MMQISGLEQNKYCVIKPSLSAASYCRLLCTFDRCEWWRRSVVHSDSFIYSLAAV